MSRLTIEAGGVKVETSTEALAAVSGVLGGNASSKLRSLVERIERLKEDRAAVMADLKEVYAEAKGEGFDTKILRKVIRQRALDAAKVSEEAALIELYLDAIGR